MPRVVRLSDGTTGMFDDEATDAQIDEQLRRDGLTRIVEPSTTDAGPVAPIPGGAIPAYIASTLNSLMLGAPELAARAMGYGPNIEATRRESPAATTAGDITGLISPARLGMKATEKAISSGMNALRGPAAREAEKKALFPTLKNTDAENRATQAASETAKAMPTSFDQAGRLAGRVLQRTAGYAGGILGAQTGAAALGGAREPSPDFPYYGGAGAQQGAQVFRQAAMNAPLTGLVPGLQPTIGAVTSAVPGLLGYGSLAGQYRSIEERMREEAARRALQGR